MASPNIRKFRPQDAAEIRSLISSIMEREFPGDAEAYPTDDLEDISRHYGHIGEAFFVAENDNGHIVGTIAIKRDDERHALLRRFFVLPEYRGKSVGKKLLQHLIDFCREVGYQEIVVKTTTNMKRAIKVCRDHGFAEKARVDLGGIKLCKLALFLRENSPLAA
ncbi:MAG: GNAT family N-acetyltransferase [Candidatus Omnitrophica bacterium]|nr:GNAT family N-acetyltransferase [Candidatus Omnitrophota bacterium]